jgi:predicted nucleotidyltransferase
MEAYRETWRARLAAEDAATRARAARAARVAGELADLLRAAFGARRVILIGSLARGEFGPRSDIDLVVEGLRPADLFRATARLQAVAGDIEVDLAPAEDLRARTRRAITEEGVAL